MYPYPRVYPTRPVPAGIPVFTRKERHFSRCWSYIDFFCFFLLKIVLTIKVKTRNSSGDEIANVNFLCDDIVHALKYNRLLHKFRYRSFFLQRMFTKFSEITQCNGHYAVQGHSKSPILVPIESSYTTSY